MVAATLGANDRVTRGDGAELDHHARGPHTKEESRPYVENRGVGQRSEIAEGTSSARATLVVEDSSRHVDDEDITGAPIVQNGGVGPRHDMGGGSLSPEEEGIEPKRNGGSRHF